MTELKYHHFAAPNEQINPNIDHQWLLIYKESQIALAAVVQLVRYHPAKRMVAGSIPGQGTCLGFRFHPQVRAPLRGNQWMFLSHIDVSLPLFLPPFPSS